MPLPGGTCDAWISRTHQYGKLAKSRLAPKKQGFRGIVNDPAERGRAISEAMEWVSRILAAVVFMVAPGLAGTWLDRRFGTGFFVLLGFALGLSGGIWYLIIITSSIGKGQKKNDQDDNGPNL